MPILSIAYSEIFMSRATDVVAPACTPECFSSSDAFDAAIAACSISSSVIPGTINAAAAVATVSEEAAANVEDASLAELAEDPPTNFKS